MGRTCGEPNEIELAAIGVELNGSQGVVTITGHELPVDVLAVRLELCKRGLDGGTQTRARTPADPLLRRRRVGLQGSGKRTCERQSTRFRLAPRTC